MDDVLFKAVAVDSMANVVQQSSDGHVFDISIRYSIFRGKFLQDADHFVCQMASSYEREGVNFCIWDWKKLTDAVLESSMSCTWKYMVATNAKLLNVPESLEFWTIDQLPAIGFFDVITWKKGY